MNRILHGTLACVLLAGCITNNQTSQNSQLMPGGASGAPGGAVAVARAPLPSTAPILTPAARLANSRIIAVNKTTTSGATLMLASPQSLARDCTPLGHVDAKVTTPPSHGTISIEDGTAFSNYTPGDPPYLCNSRKSPATLIAYRSASGFSGQDAMAVQIFFPDGHAPTMLFRIDVR